MNNTKPRHPRAYYIFWTLASIGAFAYCGAMFAQYLAS